MKPSKAGDVFIDSSGEAPVFCRILAVRADRFFKGTPAYLVYRLDVGQIWMHLSVVRWFKLIPKEKHSLLELKHPRLFEEVG